MSTAWTAIRRKPSVSKNAYYQANKHKYTHYYSDGFPQGQYVGHCGRWQRVEQLPHVCICCEVRLFAEEDMPHG